MRESKHSEHSKQSERECIKFTLSISIQSKEALSTKWPIQIRSNTLKRAKTIKKREPIPTDGHCHGKEGDFAFTETAGIEPIWSDDPNPDPDPDPVPITETDVIVHVDAVPLR